MTRERLAPSRPWWVRTLIVVFFLGILYLTAMLFLLGLENRLLFPASTSRELWYPPPESLSPRDVELSLADGTPIHGWWCAPPGWAPEHGAILLCHGNSGN